MPLFGLKNARRKMSSPSLSLGLRKTQSTGDIEDSVVIKPRIITSKETISILRLPDSKRPPTPPSQQSMIILEPVIEDDFDDKLLASKLKDITACDMELLLSLETQARMDCQEEKEKKQLQSSIRPCKIKFALPITPPRSKSPDPNIFHATRQRRWSLPDDKKKYSGRLTRWSKLIKQQQQEEAQNNKMIQQSDSSSSSSSEEDLVLNIQDIIVLGSKVKLFKRPLPIIGIVKYVGKVHFDSGEWLGIELTSRGM